MLPAKCHVAIYSMLLMTSAFLQADLPGSPSSTGSSTQMSPTPTSAPKGVVLPQRPTKPVMPFTPLPRVVLPAMNKPFNMPGVIGWTNEKWEGSDYLGYLSSHISVSVEILKGEHVPNLPSEGVLEAQISDIFTKELLTPHANVEEGPPLPFFHVLVIAYAAEKDSQVIFTAARLFERVEVMRNNFKPAGFWQAITWERQNVMLTATAELEAKVKASVDQLTKEFVARYRQYNPSNPEETAPVPSEKPKPKQPQK